MTLADAIAIAAVLVAVYFGWRNHQLQRDNADMQRENADMQRERDRREQEDRQREHDADERRELEAHERKLLILSDVTNPPTTTPDGGGAWNLIATNQDDREIRALRFDAYFANHRIDSVGGNDLTPGETVVFTITVPPEQARMLIDPANYARAITIRAVDLIGRTWDRPAEPRYLELIQQALEREQ